MQWLVNRCSAKLQVHPGPSRKSLRCQAAQAPLGALLDFLRSPWSSARCSARLRLSRSNYDPRARRRRGQRCGRRGAVGWMTIWPRRLRLIPGGGRPLLLTSACASLGHGWRTLLFPSELLRLSTEFLFCASVFFVGRLLFTTLSSSACGTPSRVAKHCLRGPSLNLVGCLTALWMSVLASSGAHQRCHRPSSLACMPGDSHPSSETNLGSRGLRGTTPESARVTHLVKWARRIRGNKAQRSRDARARFRTPRSPHRFFKSRGHTVALSPHVKLVCYKARNMDIKG